ncbi:MAG: hypothetical protein K2X87_06400, partial [Gemmataceae bacterium]|nr:hypothetical protein [Gemmataceae bacterium]
MGTGSTPQPGPDPALTLAALYAIAGLAAIGAAGGGIPNEFWPPAGVALGGVVRWGVRAWPGVTVGAVAVEGLVVGPGWAAVAIAAGLTAGAALGAYLVQRLG